ncbi:hypothetical protein PHET_07697 [Paragonimus heterotremus]|uniref:Uncharacterized protein n=1 Tax=Paragonimus heterotremus TaxID=100268 RepID=A0A8J4TD32_9TREM|nr:hypothetical protein PHET_07697 [Paragonimus heterotremus]
MLTSLKSAEIICKHDDFKIIHSCMHIHTEFMHFCEANSYCNNRSSLPNQRAYLIGAKYERSHRLQIFRDDFWTSLTELHKPSLDDPRILKSGDPQMAVITLPDSKLRSDIDYTGKPLRIYRKYQLEPADEGTLAFPLCETIELPTKYEESTVVKSLRLKVESNPEDIFASRSGTRDVAMFECVEWPTTMQLTNHVGSPCTSTHCSQLKLKRKGALGNEPK